MKNCPNCGKEYEENAKFCTYCGTKIENEKASDSFVKTRFCSNCGSKVNENDNNCSMCGSNLNNNAQSNINNSSSQKVYGQNIQSNANKKSESGTAVAALILTIMGMLSCIFPLLILGIIFGFIGKKKYERNTQEYTMCTASIIIGFICIVFVILVVVFFWVFATNVNIINAL